MDVGASLVRRAEVAAAALNLDSKARRELALSLLWSLPRNEVVEINERLFSMMQKDLVGLLPVEIAIQILAHLDMPDILKCSLVCRNWAKRINEQSLWALLCNTHVPPISPASPTWADLSMHRHLMHMSSRTVSPPSPFADDGDSDDNVEMDLIDAIRSHGGFPSSAGASSSPSSRPGIRRGVWERSGSSALPMHMHFQSSKPAPVPSLSQGDPTSTLMDEPPLQSHLPLPTPLPQVNFKHLYIVHHVLQRRMRGLISPALYNVAGPSTPSHNSRWRKPKSRAFDAITSIEAGGLPGHSECIYSLELIHRTMRISMPRPCDDCVKPSFTSPFDALVQPTTPRGSRRTSHPSLDANSHHSTATVSGREWLLSCSRDTSLRLWQLNCAKPRVVKIFHGGHAGSVLSLCVVEVPVNTRDMSKSSSSSSFGISPSRSAASPGKLREPSTRVLAVSSGGDGKICLWDIEHGDGRPELAVQAHEDSVLCVRADDERIVSCSKDKTIRVFDINTLEQLVLIGGNQDGHRRGAVNAVALSKKYIVSASGDKTIRVWDIHTGALLTSVEAHSRGIASIAFSTTPSPHLSYRPRSGREFRGTIIAGSSDASIRTFYLSARTNRSSVSTYAPSVNGSTAELVPPMEDLTFREMLDTEDDVVMAPPTPVGPIHPGGGAEGLMLEGGPPCWSPCTCSAGMRVEGRPCGRCMNRGHTDLVRSLHMCEDVVFSGSYDTTVKVWDRKTGSLLLDLAGAHTGRVFAVTGDRCKIVSSGLDTRIVIWDFAEGLDTAFIKP